MRGIQIRTLFALREGLLPEIPNWAICSDLIRTEQDTVIEIISFTPNDRTSLEDLDLLKLKTEPVTCICWWMHTQTLDCSQAYTCTCICLSAFFDMFGAEYVSALNNTSMLSVGSGQIDKSDQIYSILFFSPVQAFWLKFSYVVWRTSKERFTSISNTCYTYVVVFFCTYKSNNFIYEHAQLPIIFCHNQTNPSGIILHQTVSFFCNYYFTITA